MAAGKLPPRQKMIGMMYLVLTALLALNVSKSILDAFVIINNGLEKTKTNFKEKNESDYSAFEKAYNENKNKVGPYYTKAQEVKKIADELVSYIDKIKAKLIAECEGIPENKVVGKDQSGRDTILNIKWVNAKDNYDIPTHILIGDDPAKPKSGELTASDLRKRMESFKEKLLSIIGNDPNAKALVTAINETYDFSDKRDASGTLHNWESYYFDHVPLAATVSILTKMQTDVRNSESDVVKFLLSSVDASSFKFNKLAPAVIANSNYILIGDSFRAEVFLAAFDTTQAPLIYVGTELDTSDPKDIKMKGSYDSLKITPDGKGILKIQGKSEGEFTYKGIINFKAPGGKILKYPWKTTFQVAKPSATISPTKMNVFYIGVDNPVSISAPGVPADKIKASISGGGGSIVKKGNEWIVRVKTPGKCTISVTADVGGVNKKMGEMEFRVKQIPNPVPYVGGKTGSDNITAAQLKATSGILVKMENFDFEVNVTVTSYLFSTVIAGTLVEEKVTGNTFNSKVKDLIDKVKRNQKVYFEKITVKMPDGTVRELPPVSLKII